MNNMADFIILEGDQAVFIPSFGAATVVVRPGIMQGTGQTTLTGRKICLRGDESRLMVAGCIYMTPVYTIPGIGTIRINALGVDQTSQKTTSGSKSIILKGSTFTAVFAVQTPAQDPTPTFTGGAPIPDATPQYPGKGNFITSNTTFTAG